jgi:hypothetical protein
MLVGPVALPKRARGIGLRYRKRAGNAAALDEMRRVVRFTANFDSNLESIRNFAIVHESSGAFAKLIDHLFQELIPNLERFPELGRDVVRVPVQSLQAQARHRLLLAELVDGDSVREYIAGDYLVLYGVRGRYAYLLAIRHHKQLSFDLSAHWR